MSKSQPVIPVNMTVYGNRVFADIIKDLKMNWALNPKTSVLTRDRRENTNTETDM